MSETIGKNYFLAVVVGGKVVANYYTNSLAVIPELKEKYKGCEVEWFDIKKYGHSFGPAPVIKVDGGRISGIRCRETGQRWKSAKECCEAIGMPLKTLYTAIRRGRPTLGLHFDYFNGKTDD